MIVRISPVYQFDYHTSSKSIYHGNKGEGLPEHTHTFDHANYCSSGSCIVRVFKPEGIKEVILTKLSQPIDLKANIPHEIEVLEDNTVFINILPKF